MKRCSLLVLSLATACGRSEPSPPSGAETIPCATRGEVELKRLCIVSRSKTDAGLMLTLTGPDGTFRRLLIAKDGRGVIAADGAEPAKVEVIGAREIQVSIGGERYRLPATVQ